MSTQTDPQMPASWRAFLERMIGAGHRIAGDAYQFEGEWRVPMETAEGFRYTATPEHDPTGAHGDAAAAILFRNLDRQAR